MNLDEKACYAALRANDTRFDGKFFVGVSSTGIYCRPICRVKTPKAENCTFFISAAAAETAGYRPCLKCRPELAPGMSAMDGGERLVRYAIQRMEADGLADGNLTGLAAGLGVTDRHLRRVFNAQFGVSPLKYLHTWRLLLAKSLLTDTSLAVTEIALTAGFGSVRQFNALFQKQYHLTPGSLRKKEKRAADGNDRITLLLGYRPPYAWEEILDFLAYRAIPGVEKVSDGKYYRTVTIQKGERSYLGWFSVSNQPDKNALSVTLASPLLPVLPHVLSRIRTLFDLNCSPQEIGEKLEVMNEIKEGIFLPGIRLPGCFDPFEMAVRAILGQQVTVKAARTLAGRLAAAYGEPVNTPYRDLNTVFPAPGKIYGLDLPIANQLGPLGITGARARSIYALAEAMVQGSITLSGGADPELEIEALLKLPGFGPWTAQYVGMRALGWPDAFPHTDYGVKLALGGMKPKEIMELSQAWKPWRSYATILLWHSLKA